MLSKEQIYSRIQKSGNLPTLPEILLKLLEACENEATPISDIASIISKDPVISFKVLQLVNSAYYGLRKKFTGIEQAVVYLGANSIKNIAITTSIHQVFEKKKFKNVKRFNINTFWYNSLLTATLATRIAEKVGYENLEEVYLAGLLHDIGRLILVSTFPKEHESILLKTQDIQNVLWAEKQLIGITHCEVGAWLINNWKLDSLIADAVRYHHESHEQVREAFPLVKIIHLSSLLCENGHDDDIVIKAADDLFGLADTDLLPLVDGATDLVLEIADNLEIRVQKPNGEDEELEENLQDGSGEHATSASVTAGEQQKSLDESDDAREDALKSRVKSITLLSGFLESLVQAGDTEEVLTAFEEAMNILFDIEKVVLFLPDKSGVHLQGRTSATSSMRELSQGLTLSVQRSSSQIVQSYNDAAIAYLTTRDTHENLADRQILKAFACQSLLIMPLLADKHSAGVALLALPESVDFLSRSDAKLLKIISQQVGLCLYLESIKKKKAEEIEAERMAAVSMTARKVAHEINNPLGIITNYLATMSLKFSEDKKMQEELGIIGEEISRISSMVNQMDLVSQSAFENLEKVDVNQIISDIVALVRPSLFKPSDIVLSFRPEIELPKIMLSGDALKQIMINLLKNSSEAMGSGGGDVTIKTSSVTKGAYEDGQPEKDGIEIVVEDTGPGLTETVVKNLFKPFVTTKTDGHSGLGLSIIHKAVNELGGSISCTSEPGEGTRFMIYFPISSD